jgi:hypothetical protein
MNVYTKSLRDHSANFDHKFNLNCHEVFNITKVELQVMAYQRNLQPVLFNKSQFSANHCRYCVQVCAKMFLLPC